MVTAVDVLVGGPLEGLGEPDVVDEDGAEEPTGNSGPPVPPLPAAPDDPGTEPLTPPFVPRPVFNCHGGDTEVGPSLASVTM